MATRRSVANPGDYLFGAGLQLIEISKRPTNAASQLTIRLVVAKQMKTQDRLYPLPDVALATLEQAEETLMFLRNYAWNANPAAAKQTEAEMKKWKKQE